MAICSGCGEAFRQTRDDARFCSNKCRQSDYRRRVASGEKARARSREDINDAIHLDDIAGVLHYQGKPIIAIDRLHPSWPGYGNRYVCMFPSLDRDASAAMRTTGLSGWSHHLFECLECRRWSVGLALSFCSRKCRLAHRAAEARERRATPPPRSASPAP